MYGSVRASSLALAGALFFTALPAGAFEIAFDWSGLKSCRNGIPDTVDSPAFALKDVPEGARFIRFRLTDRDVPGFDHGGGVVAWSGQRSIPRGAFRYKSPCPPSGSHTYEWKATAQTKKNGGRLAEAVATRRYPE